MREILFRGIPKDDVMRHFFADIWKDDCDGSFVYGSLIISKDKYYICVSALCRLNCCVNNGMASMIEVIPETVGQYVMTDSIGNKIFEGDIVKGTDRLEKELEVYGYIDHKNGSFVIVGDFMTHYRWLDYYDVEVIGNIHDNPELLKGGAEE